LALIVTLSSLRPDRLWQKWELAPSFEVPVPIFARIPCRRASGRGSAAAPRRVLAADGLIEKQFGKLARRQPGERAALGNDTAGRLYIWNEKIRIKASRQGKGLASQVLRAQVENAYAFGIAYLACHAARVNAARPERPFSGYLVWPARGYDQSLDELANGTHNGDEVRKGAPAAFPEVAEAIRRRFGGEVQTILDLMSKVDGPTWWQENGVELYNAVFDLSAGSRSLQVLNDYFLAPKRGGTPLCLKNPT